MVLIQEGPMPLSAMLFDLDGTITRPLLDFPAIKREIGLPADSYILEALQAMTPAERERAMAVVERHEAEAAARSKLNHGARELLEELHRRGVLVGVVTRNSEESAATVLRLHGLQFDVIVCRDHAAPKPSPEGIRLALQRLNVPPSAAVYVGDHAIDVAAGHAAGTRTIWVANGGKPSAPPDADFRVETLQDVLGLLDALQGD